MKKRVILLMLIFLLVLSFNQALAEKPVELYFFYGQGCQHCARAELFLDEMEKECPTLNILRKEIYSHPENAQLLELMASSYGKDIKGIPVFFIDKEVFIGFNDNVAAVLKERIEYYSVEGCISPAAYVKENKQAVLKRSVTIPAVIAAAAVDAINPCAFAVLIILLTTILATKSRKRALFAGLAFTISIYISYLLMGLGLYSAVNAVGITRWFYVVVAVLAVLLGLFNLKDYLWYGRWFIMEVPLTWRPRLLTVAVDKHSGTGLITGGPRASWGRAVDIIMPFERIHTRKRDKRPQ